MTETLCDSGAVKFKAGVNVSSAITAGQYTEMINEAESFINDSIKEEGVDYVAGYAGYPENKKMLLHEAASCHAAVSAINHDMSGYTTNVALSMINILWAKMMECIRMLKDKKHTDYMKAA